MSRTDWPVLLYLYDETGRHGAPIEIRSTEALQGHRIRSLVQNNMEAGNEVRMTDPADILVFHAVRGVVVWPTPEVIERKRMENQNGT